MRGISLILAMVAALILAFYALAARAAAPLTILSAVNSFDVHEDGSYVNDYRTEMRPENDAAARRDGQQVIDYAPSLETLVVLEAYTRKADGRVLPVAPAAIRDQLAPGTADRALITDLRERVLVFPELEGGDTLVYAVRRIVHRPPLPHQFLISVYLSRGVPLLDYTLRVRAPQSLQLHSEAHELTQATEADGGAILRTWHAAIPVADEPASALGPYDRLPRLFVSSERDYAAFGRDYAALALPHARVTPQLQALAGRIVGGAADRREQARRLYEWVSAHIRYLALYLGDGALEPHDAATVLANGWGDCKDHVVLLHALLAARGIPAEMVMLNLGNTYALGDPPTFAALNHAITYLPEFDLYVDSTAAMAPFGTLAFSAYGKPAVHARPDGGVLRQIPLLAPGAAAMELHTAAVLHEDGSITGTTQTSASGPFATDLRRDAAWVETTGAAAAAVQLRALGSDGYGRFSFAAPETPGADYAMSGSFTLAARPDLLTGDSFALPLGLRLLARPGEVLLAPGGAQGVTENDPVPCHSGRQTEEVVLTLPAGRRLRRLPQDVRIDTDSVGYRGTWRLEGATLTHRAELLVRTRAALCAGDERRRMAAELERIRRDLRAQVTLSDEVVATQP